MKVIIFPQHLDPMSLWDRYTALVKEVMDDPSLEDDWRHKDARNRAHQRFTQAFSAEDDGA